MTPKCWSREILGNHWLLILGTIFIASTGAHKVKKNVHHLEDHKFALEDYLDPEIDERDTGPVPPISPLDRPFRKFNFSSYSSASQYSDKLDESIKWDATWRPMNYELGQISGVSITPDNNVAIFHRGERVWDGRTFDNANKFNPNKGPIREATILLVDKSGLPLMDWGKNMFYLPHGLTVDSLGNYWLTDVAMHQVFKFDAMDIQQHRQQLQRQRSGERQNLDEQFSPDKLFANSPIKPSITLGVPFEPGNDKVRFCKPTYVAVEKSGDFFVSDGYCNSRIIKYNKDGERILEWGRNWSFQQSSRFDKRPPPTAFLIPHALALAEDYGYIFVADRENGRVVCFASNNGTFLKEYQKPVVGGEIYSVAYAQDRLYLVNGNQAMDASTPYPHVRGFVLNIHTGDVLSQFAPHLDMSNPHDIAVSLDSREIYVVELNSHKVYRFLQDTSKMTANLRPSSRDKPTADGRTQRLSHGSVDPVETKKISEKSSFVLFSTFSAAVMLVILCVVVAALIARRQKRGRLPHTESVVKFQKLLVED